MCRPFVSRYNATKPTPNLDTKGQADMRRSESRLNLRKNVTADCSLDFDRSRLTVFTFSAMR
jgi:hypothetical protein